MLWINIKLSPTIKGFVLYYTSSHKAATTKSKTLDFRSNCCASLMFTVFPGYICVYTSVHLVVSLEWGIHGLCILLGSFGLTCESVTSYFVFSMQALNDTLKVLPLARCKTFLTWCTCISVILNQCCNGKQI